MKMMNDAIRGFLWGIVQVVLTLSDWVYDMVNQFLRIDISTNNVIWYIYSFGLLFLFFACSFRLFFVIVSKMSNDEEQLDVGYIGKRIVHMFLVVALIPTFFTFSLGLPNTINSIFNNSVSMGEPMTPSTSILTSIAKTPLSGELNDMRGNDEIITIDTISENLNEQQNDKYIYFNGYGEIFFCLIMGILIAFALVNVFTQIVERWFIQILRLFIGFIPISGMVDPQDKSCNQWIRDIISDVLVQSWSLISLWAVFAIMGLDAISSVNGIIRLFMFWIGIMAITKLGDMIAKYLQATDLSKGSKIGSAMASVGMYGLARGGAALGKAGLSFAGNTALSGGAGAIQQIGERMGGKSMQEMGFANAGISGNPNMRSGNGFHSNTYADGMSGMNTDSDPLSASPTGTMDSSLNTDNMMNTADAGAQGASVFGESGAYQQQQDMRNDSADSASSAFTGEETLNESVHASADSADSRSQRQEELSEMQRLTRPDTFARRFVDSANTAGGIRGSAMRTASNVGSHLYVASASRYSNSALRKANTILKNPSINPNTAQTAFQNMNDAGNSNSSSYRNTAEYTDRKPSKSRYEPIDTLGIENIDTLGSDKQ